MDAAAFAPKRQRRQADTPAAMHGESPSRPSAKLPRLAGAADKAKDAVPATHPTPPAVPAESARPRVLTLAEIIAAKGATDAGSDADADATSRQHPAAGTIHCCPQARAGPALGPNHCVGLQPPAEAAGPMCPHRKCKFPGASAPADADVQPSMPLTGHIFEGES